MAQTELIFNDVFQRTPDNLDKESNNAFGLIKFEKPIEIHSAWVSEIKTKGQPNRNIKGSLEFFARDITEQSSRYLELGTHQYTDSCKIVFPAGLPFTNQIFLRGSFENLSVKLFGKIIHNYAPVAIKQLQQPQVQQPHIQQIQPQQTLVIPSVETEITNIPPQQLFNDNNVIHENTSTNFVPIVEEGKQLTSFSLGDSKDMSNDIIYNLLPCLSFSAFHAQFRDLQCYIFQTKATIKGLVMNTQDDDQIVERFVYLCQCLEVRAKKERKKKEEEGENKEEGDNEDMNVENVKDEKDAETSGITSETSADLCNLTNEQILDEIDSMNIGSINLTQEKFQMLKPTIEKLVHFLLDSILPAVTTEVVIEPIIPPTAELRTPPPSPARHVSTPPKVKAQPEVIW